MPAAPLAEFLCPLGQLGALLRRQHFGRIGQCQAALERERVAQQAARDAQARDALARSAADTQRALNSGAPPAQPANVPSVPVPPNVNCIHTGIEWRCAGR